MIRRHLLAHTHLHLELRYLPPQNVCGCWWWRPVHLMMPRGAPPQPTLPWLGGLPASAFWAFHGSRNHLLEEYKLAHDVLHTSHEGYSDWHSVACIYHFIVEWPLMVSTVFIMSQMGCEALVRAELAPTRTSYTLCSTCARAPTVPVLLQRKVPCSDIININT